MKLITLNIWGGRVHDALAEFFTKHQDVDIFCFQEVFRLLDSGVVPESIARFAGYEPDTDLFCTLKRYLSSHKGHFCQTFKETYGVAIFLKPHIQIIRQGEVFVAKGDWDNGKGWDDSDHDRKIQWMECSSQGTQLTVKDKKFSIINTHLTHRPEGKIDSPKRIQQSKTISEFIKNTTGPKIMAGDFNLLPDTQSIKMIEDAGMRNLVKDYKVSSTRTKLYRKFVNGPKFADYIFSSSDIQINDFRVLPDIVSDHAPLFIDFW